MWYLQADDEENIHIGAMQRHNNVLIYSLTYGTPQWRINGIQKKNWYLHSFGRKMRENFAVG